MKDELKTMLKYLEKMERECREKAASDAKGTCYHSAASFDDQALAYRTAGFFASQLLAARKPARTRKTAKGGGEEMRTVIWLVARTIVATVCTFATIGSIATGDTGWAWCHGILALLNVLAAVDDVRIIKGRLAEQSRAN